MNKKTIVLSFLVFGLLFFFSFPKVRAATVEELQNMINQLQQQIAQLQEQLQETNGGADPVWCHTFNQNLWYGHNGAEVKALQTVLELDGFSISSSETTKSYFGESTASAAVGFQEKYASDTLAPWGLTHGTGFVGRTTRDKLNSIYGCIILHEKSLKVISPNGGVFNVTKSSRVTWRQTGLENEKVDILLAGYDSNGNQINGWRILKKDVSASAGYIFWVPSINDSIMSTFSLLPLKYKIKVRKVQTPIQAIPGVSIIEDVSDDYFTIDFENNLSPVIDNIEVPVQLKINEKGTWTLNVHDPENDHLTCTATWGLQDIAQMGNSDEFTIDSNNDTSITFTHSYSQIGTYTINFILSDGINITRDSATVKVVSEDCHTSNPWSWNYCSSDCKCDAGQGDCDTDADCNTGYCAQNVGSKYGQVDSMDVCEEKPTLTCTDSDGGKDYYIKGTVKLGDKEKTDYCIDEDTLGEYWCTGMGGVEWIQGPESHTCHHGCKDGACQKGITILSPNGGEEWERGKVHSILWNSSGVDRILIQVNCDNVGYSIDSAYTGPSSGFSGGCYDWSITDSYPISSNCKIMVADFVSDPQKAYDLSDAPFSIVAPTIVCNDSDGGKDYYKKGTVTENGKTYTDHCVDSSHLKEYFCFPYSSTGLGGAGEENVVCPNNNSCIDGACVKEEGSITIISPNGGEKLTRGTAHNLRWTSDTTSARVVIDMLNENGKAVADGLPAVIANNEALIWNIPDSIPVGRYKMKIAICPVDFSDRDCANLDLSIYGYDISNDYFNIVGIPFISSISPISGTSNDMITVYGKNLLDTIPSGIMIEFLKNGLQKATQSSGIFLQPDGLSLKFQLSGLIVENSELGTYQIRILNDHGKSNIVDFTIISEDCHTSNLWSWDYCSSGCKCDAGKGDCDTSADCNTGYCAQNVGSKYGQVSVMDVCEKEQIITCNDSDGGKDYYQKGTVTENGKTYTDYCQGVLANSLKEYFCLPYSSTGLGGAGEEDVICPNGGSCMDGACTESEQATTCTDSDGGKNYYLKGIATGKSSWDGSLVSKTDSCYNCNNLAVTSNSCNAGADCCVSDWYCNTDGKVSAASLSCPYGCEDGACKSGGVGMKNMEDQLADVSQTISELIEKLKSFLRK